MNEWLEYNSEYLFDVRLMATNSINVIFEEWSFLRY